MMSTGYPVSITRLPTRTIVLEVDAVYNGGRRHCKRCGRLLSSFIVSQRDDFCSRICYSAYHGVMQHNCAGELIPVHAEAARDTDLPPVE